MFLRLSGQSFEVGLSEVICLVNECIGVNALIENPWKIGGQNPRFSGPIRQVLVATITDERLATAEAAGSRKNNFKLS